MAKVAKVYDVFLSYNRRDEKAARELARALKERRKQPWISADETPPGTQWMSTINKVIKTIPAAVVLIGPNGLGTWQEKEMNACLQQLFDRGLKVIPVLLPDATEHDIPPLLSDLTWVDLSMGITTRGIDKLTQAIATENGDHDTGPAPGESGAVWKGRTAHFSLFSARAEAVTLCLFDRPGSRVESTAIALRRWPNGLWGSTVSDLKPGQLYGYRVDGPWQPSQGDLFNAAKLLVDPLARAITGEPDAHPSLAAYQPSETTELSCSTDDSAAVMPKCVLVDPRFEWSGDEPLRIPWCDTVLYECHVRGLTMLHPELDPKVRGTYLGLVEPPVLAFLRRLGVTTLVLLPVQQIASEPDLLRRGLRNYWGYSPLGFCAPHAGYATGARGEQVREFKIMVQRLHRAGLEVILDMVFNHTAEGDETGPVLSLKGIDNRTYYRLDPADPTRYVNDTLCGNTLDIRQPAVRRLILESLRYWVREMHVDGFRFNLAPVLGRPEREGGADCFGTEAPLFKQIAADPVLAHVKLIAEPWSWVDFQLGRFPPEWTELNSKYRDTARRFWRGDPGELSELTTRLAGSNDVFNSKDPLSSVNFVTYHDGFTLTDLVSYEQKHNVANGYGNKDGPNDNFSRHWGCEGDTDDLRILAARDRTRRNLMASLALSQGVPMLLYGDEIGRSQRGNNNAFCQDNEISWVRWTLGPADVRFFDFVSHMLALRRRYPVLRRCLFTSGEELRWWHPSGREMQVEWHDRTLRTVAAAFLEGGDAGGSAEVLLLLNASEEPTSFQIPRLPHWALRHWIELVDTARLELPLPVPLPEAPPERLQVAPFSLRLFALD